MDFQKFCLSVESPIFALKLIEKESGLHFDPELVEIFFSCYKMIQSIQQRYKDEATPE